MELKCHKILPMTLILSIPWNASIITRRDSGSDHQRTTLTMILDIKQELQRKVRLVAGGQLIDSLDNNVYLSTVKGISVRALHVVAQK
jgi:hypothetical protein